MRFFNRKKTQNHVEKTLENVFLNNIPKKYEISLFKDFKENFKTKFYKVFYTTI